MKVQLTTNVRYGNGGTLYSGTVVDLEKCSDPLMKKAVQGLVDSHSRALRIVDGAVSAPEMPSREVGIGKDGDVGALGAHRLGGSQDPAKEQDAAKEQEDHAAVPLKPKKGQG